MLSMLLVVSGLIILGLIIIFLIFRKKFSNKFQKKFVIVLLFLVIIDVVIWLVSIFLVDDISILGSESSTNYLSGVYRYYVNGNLVGGDSGIIDSYQEFVDFKNNYSLFEYYSGEIEEDKFRDNSYIYYVSEVDKCGEIINGVNKVDISNGNANIVFNIIDLCGSCENENIVSFVPIDKEKINSINNISSTYNTVGSDNSCSSTLVKKPILYLYPTIDSNVRVSLANSNLIKSSYPKYNDGWVVKASPNGDLYDSDGKYYYALYWDEYNNHKVEFKEGFYVTKDSAIDFLEDKLSIIGLNDREKNEFIMYWLPILENNGKSLVYFELTSEREKSNKLIIEPKPDSLLRINMHIKKVSRKINIKEQNLVSFDRKGFVAVEWGGTMY